jgi:hypothetical protein
MTNIPIQINASLPGNVSAKKLARARQKDENKNIPRLKDSERDR